ncbi:unnamed protein product [Amoebophrya sp. A25]|nr:unnamed protein product [Amoebophrya sp. A25]|eukprot:GSA25T00019007001.1
MSAQGLPAHILTLFGPRPPAEPIPRVLPVVKSHRHMTGCADFLAEFEDTKPPKREVYEAPRDRRARKMKEKQEEHQAKIAELKAEYDPRNDPNSGESDPLKTVFIARISYDTSEKKLKREFEQYGPIKSLKMIYDSKSGKPRGYAFVEYEDERDAKTAYKLGDGKKIDGRRVMVDVERGRTQEGWIPRRLGGGRGSGRKARGAKASKADAGRDKAAGDRTRDRDRDADRTRDRDRGGDKERGGDRDRERRGDRDRGGDRDRRDRDRDERKRGRDDRGDDRGDRMRRRMD